MEQDNVSPTQPTAELRRKLMGIADEIAALRSPDDPRLDALLEVAAEMIGVVVGTLDRHERANSLPSY
jgi:hypothetical protein